jgi:cell wall-associated NlpC family hydrolase
MKAVVAGGLAAALGMLALPVLVLVLVASALPGVAPSLPGVAPSAPGLGAADGPRGEIAVAWALGQLGKPYRWGAAGPDAFDCSGLVLRAWQAAGVVVPRVAADQYDAGGHVPVSEAQPGDLVFFADDASDPATIVHVGISLGGDRMIDAPHTGAVVRFDTVGGAGLVPLATRPG